MTTTVVKLKRSKGEIVQGCDVYIGRRINMGGWSLPDSKWANPYKLKEHGENTLVLYEQYLCSRPDLLASLHELKGKVLGCWCKIKGYEPCHGDVLIKYVNMYCV